MKRKMRRLKIPEQIIIVVCLASFLPFVVTALIITNLNQQAVRKELKSAALIAADNIYQKIESNMSAKVTHLRNLSAGLTLLPDAELNTFVSKTASLSEEFDYIKLINRSAVSNYEVPEKLLASLEEDDPHPFYNSKEKSLQFISKHKAQYVIARLSMKHLKNKVFQNLVNDERQVYIFDYNKSLLMSHNFKKGKYKVVLSEMVGQYKDDDPVYINKIKNQPSVLIRIPDINWYVVVATPKSLTSYGIVKARYRILLVLGISALIVVFSGIAYSVSLNTTIRQLTRAIGAFGKGNYRRRIRLIKDQFTPYELVFLAEEFNRMAAKVDNAYKELSEVNEQLSKLDEMKSNLIDTVSHEFRTPLTCIKGYTSSLLRTDISLEPDTVVGSLKVIKQQAERLSRMVEDLLVIPDIEQARISLIPDEVALIELFNICISAIRQKHQKEFLLVSEQDEIYLYADPDRLEQVIINLLDNAAKYSPEESKISIKLSADEKDVNFSIFNECMPIPAEKAKILFNKFSRVEDSLTRTTRGTGLGLYITKGLIDVMKGSISISAAKAFEVFVTLPVSYDD